MTKNISVHILSFFTDNSQFIVYCWNKCITPVGCITHVYRITLNIMCFT